MPLIKGSFSGKQVTAICRESGEDIPIDTWTLAYWPDGSVKWGGIVELFTAGTEKLTLEKGGKRNLKRIQTAGYR